jgi:ribonuclease HI
MELQAVIEGLRFVYFEVGDRSATTEVCLDSKYVEEGASLYLDRWVKNGYKTQSGEPIKNKDLWEKMHEILAAARDRICWIHIKGHAGIPGNEKVDQIAQDFASGKSPALVDRVQSENYPIDLDVITEKNGTEGCYPHYMSWVDNVLLTHATWSECEDRIKGKSGAKCKKVKSEAEKLKVLKDWGFKG